MKPNKTEEESGVAALVAVGVGVFIAVLAYSLQCSAQMDCLAAGTCTSFGDGSCSFANAVTPASYKIFNLSTDMEALASLTRGVCAAGERQNLDVSGRLACVRAPTFPDAFNYEAASVDAYAPVSSSSGSSPSSPSSPEHRKACGRWIDSSVSSVSGVSSISAVSSQSVEYFSFFDEAQVAADVERELRDEFNPLVAVTDVDRFRSACERMLVNSAESVSTSNGYDHLKREMGINSVNSVEGIDSVDDALQAVGKLASFGCDAPVQLGVTFDSSGFLLFASDGATLDADTAAEVLYAVGELADERERARAFIAEAVSAPSSLATPPTQAQLDRVVHGAAHGEFMDDALSINSPMPVHHDASLDSLARFLYAIEETDFQHTAAYLKSMAALCSFAAAAVVTDNFGTNFNAKAATERIATTATTATTATGVARRRRAVALGRLQSVERFAPIDHNDTKAATTMTISQVSFARSNSRNYNTHNTHNTHNTYASTSNPETAKRACFDAAALVFPDQLDAKVFQKMVSKPLLDTLPGLVESLKAATASQLQSGRMSTLVADPVERSALAQAARSVRFRIAGAPRTSNFGRSRAFERPQLDSNDGAIVILLKQARAVSLDRLALAVQNENLCEHPPLFSSLSRNAYLLTAAPCSMLLPAILTPPFASDRFDERSLYSKIGFVISHEVAHVASRPEIWDQQEREKLLKNYTSSSMHVEAAADLTAADALVSTGKVTTDFLCKSVSQTWCARVGVATTSSTSSTSSTASHPPANVRGDNICAFLKS